MATPDEIKKLLKQLDDAYKKLGTEKNPFANFDVSNIKDAVSTVNQLKAALEGVNNRIEATEASFQDLSDTLKSIVKEIDPKAYNATKEFSNGFKNIVKEAKKLVYEENNLSKLDKKQLEQLKEKIKQSKLETKSAAEQVLVEARINKEINQQSEAFEKLTEEQQAAVRFLKDELSSIDTIIDKTNQRIKQEERLEKLMGLGGAAVTGTQKALTKLGFGGLANALGLDQVKAKMQETAETIEKGKNNTASFANKFKVLQSGIKEAGVQLKNSLKDPATVVGFLVDQMIDALKKADSATGDLAKSFGTSYKEALNIRNELSIVANLSGDININVGRLQEALVAVNKEFGTAAMFSGEFLKDFTRLTKVIGYSEAAAAGLSRITVVTGTDLSDNTSKILGQAKAFNATNKLALNEKTIVEGVARASAATTISLGMNVDRISKAVLQAKAFGATLEDIERSSQALLNFESSIASELEAELLTGKNINLERARLYALNNDIEGVAREISREVGSAAEFGKMNVIQQEALAKSVGMERESLSKALIEREALSKIGAKDSAAAKEKFDKLVKQYGYERAIKELGDETYAKQLASQSVQERFLATVEKLKEVFVSLAGPVLEFISPIVDILAPVLSVISGILGGIANIASAIGKSFSGFGGILLGLIPILMNLGLIMRSFALLGLKGAIAAIFRSFASIPFGLGIPLAVAAVAGLGALISSASSKITSAGDMFSPADGKTQVSTKEGGLFQLSPNDDFIAAPGISNAIKNNKKTNNTTVVNDNANMVAAMEKIANRPIIVTTQVDGREIAKTTGRYNNEYSNQAKTTAYQIA